MTILLALLAGILPAQPNANVIQGRWHATVRNPAGDEVAFQLELRKLRRGWQGTLINGQDRNASTSGTFDGAKLRLHFDYWDAVLDAALDRNQWQGSFTRTYRKTTLVRKFMAQRDPIFKLSGKPTANLTGEWLLDVNDDGKVSTYRAVLKQQNEKLEGTLLHVTGDSGVLTGYVEDNYAVMSRFDGIRATLLKLRVGDGDSITGTMDSSKKVSGRRAPAAMGDESFTVTRMRNPSEPLRFSFPDLDGKPVASTDERFRGKALLVTIMGSWCPNCHDEAVFLIELYDKFRGRGLEIVALGFEYTGEAPRDVRQLKIFAQRYRVPYPILYAGATEDAEKTLVQIEGFRSYPTTILTGRDGKVRLIHTGFDGPATGARFTQLKRDITAAVEQALGQ